MYSTNPIANIEAVIEGDRFRFTVLTERLIRIEYSDTGIFQDNRTQMVINRHFELPVFYVNKSSEKLEISTSFFTLTYYFGKVFSKNSLFAKLKNEHSCNTWKFGDKSSYNTLPGTVRTLDGVNGEIELEASIMSKDSFSQLDDSNSYIVTDKEILPRNTRQTDLYLFAHTDDYYGLLNDFYKLTGYPPLLPRYVFGNIWSRYHKYTQQEYLQLMDRFKKEDYPFSVAAIDMDWHLVNVDSKYGSGWTGYTWNRELFPDYKKFLSELHKRDLKVTLNLHPSEGVAPYEEMYEDMAAVLSVKNGEVVPFDLTDSNFKENYFKILHHPYEKDGVDFWWIDWQQGNTSKYENLDPLWLLNHYHTLDMTEQNKRGLILSRYAGIGSHRYPIGFSGDTVISWESLDFQAYFTVCSSNSGFSWWSHDIGGFMGGYRDDELYARWVQFGVFSPICRLHSTFREMMRKEPWYYDKPTEQSVKSSLQLRHRLVPYLYSMNYRSHKKGMPLISPLYYKNPKEIKAYDKKFRNEYYFGSEMLVSPITSPADSLTRFGSTLTFIPDGIWFDYFTGRCYKGNKVLRLFRNLNEYPVLVKAGGIIPHSGDEIKNDVSNPEIILLKVYAGADNTFEMYEDDGISNDYTNGIYAITKFELNFKENFIIHKPIGDTSVIPANRSYEIEFIGFENLSNLRGFKNGIETDFEIVTNKNITKVYIPDVKEEVVINFGEDVSVAEQNLREDLIEFLLRCQGDNMQKQGIYKMLISENYSKEKLLLYMNEINPDPYIRDSVIEFIMADN